MEALQLHLVFLVLLAAVLHASWNAFVKGTKGDRFLTFTAVRGTATVFALLALAFAPIPEPAAWPYMIGGIAIHNGYYIFLLKAYRYGDLSHVYPLARGVAPLTVAVLAAVFAGEAPGAGDAAGILLVSMGIVSLMFAGSGVIGQTRGEAARPVFFAVGTGLLIACYTVVDGIGIRAGGTALGYIVWLNAGEGLPFMITAAVRRRRDMAAFLKANWPRTTGAGAVLMAAYALVLFALSQGAMAHVSALRETSVLFAAVIGAVFLKEPFGRLRIAAAVAIVTGVVLLQVAG